MDSLRKRDDHGQINQCDQTELTLHQLLLQLSLSIEMGKQRIEFPIILYLYIIALGYNTRDN